MLGAALTTVGAGLLYTLDIGSSAAHYIGYQIIVGMGIGLAIQIPVIAGQAFSDPFDIPCVTAIVLCKAPTTSCSIKKKVNKMQCAIVILVLD